MFRMMPGSPDRVIKNPNLTPEMQAATRARWGLDKPLIPDQLVAYAKATVTGALGVSIFYRGQPVTDVLASSIGPPILLVGLAELLAIVSWLADRDYAG